MEFTSPLEPGGKHDLRGRTDREKEVGDPLESLVRTRRSVLRSRDRDPAQLHLRKPAELRDSIQAEREGASPPEQRGETCLVWRPSEIAEDLVRDERHLSLCAERFDRVRFALVQAGSGRIVGLDRDHSADPRGQKRLERVQVHAPAGVVAQPVRGEAHALQTRERLEEGIARARNEDLVTRIAEESKEVRVGLARAGGEEDPGWIACVDASRAVIRGDRCANLLRAARIGIVAGDVLVPERGGRDRRKPAPCGIRVREIDDPASRASLLLDQDMERIGLEIAREASGRGQSFALAVAMFQIVFTAASNMAARSAGQKPLMLNFGTIHATKRRIRAFTTK